jgi:hypothetical protein
MKTLLLIKEVPLIHIYAVKAADKQLFRLGMDIHDENVAIL